MIKGPLVMMMLDSLADAYVGRGDTPYFSSRIQDGKYTSLESLFAFEGIMAAVMTGHWPDETGVFARFAYGPSESVYRKSPLRLLNMINRHAYYADGERRDGKDNFPLLKAYRRYLRKNWRSGGFSNLTTYGRLPLALAPQFRYSMTLGAYDGTDELAGYETLFGACKKIGRKCHYSYGPLSEVRQKLERIPDINDYGLLFIHTWSHLDTEGHNYGPESEDIRQMTRDCDRELGEFLPWLESRLTDASFIFFADHGMHPVHTTLDVADIVTEAIDGTGPLVFVDSTAVRAWGSDTALASLSSRLGVMEGVKMLQELDLREKHTWFPDRTYGQLFAVAKPGFVFAPDFFVGWEPRKGMHGYFECTDWLRSSCLWIGSGFSNDKIEPEKIVDIYQLAASALDLS